MRSTRKSPIHVACCRCHGSGKVELAGVYAQTVALVAAHPGCNGSELAELAKCKIPAMCNRLKRLEAMGVVIGNRSGVSVFWKVK